MTTQKQQLTIADLNAQTALELPDRETLALVVLGGLIGPITITVRNIDIAANICAAVIAANVGITCDATA